jgi:hypothetical protein
LRVFGVNSISVANQGFSISLNPRIACCASIAFDWCCQISPTAATNTTSPPRPFAFAAIQRIWPMNRSLASNGNPSAVWCL